MWIYFDDIPSGAWFTLMYLSPAYTKINSHEAESQSGAITIDRIAELTSGYVYISAMFVAPIKRYP